MSIDAVVVNHDAGNALIECVSSLRRQGVSRIVVVDNASSDGSLEALVKEDPQVHAVRSRVNLGYGAGANRGISVSTGEMVLVTNPDVVVQDGSIARLESHLRSDPDVAIVGPKILQPDGTVYPSARRFPSYHQAMFHALFGRMWPRNRFSSRYRMPYTGSVVPTEVDWVSGACFLARRRTLAELGGFDESYFMYVEDLDLCYRARRAGWRVLYDPDALIMHIQGVSTSQRPYRMLWEHHRSTVLFAHRRAKGVTKLATPLVAAFLGVRFLAECARQFAGQRRKGGLGSG